MSETIIADALERFKESEEGTHDARLQAESDIKFARLGEQWDKEIVKIRKEENRPCLTINKLPAFIRQVVNEARQNKPAITVHPIDNGADPDTAEVISGLVRSIERRSNADVAYDTAIDHAASGGFGFFQVAIDYSHDESFDLECRIERVPNPLMVHWDPSSTAFDASDWGFAFISDFLDEDDFEVRYPKAAKVAFEGDGKNHGNLWLQQGRIRVADYWLREETARKILLLSDGVVIRESEYKDEVKAFLDWSGVTVLRERNVQAHSVMRRKISGVEVLEEEVWPGSTIPICPVWGEEVMIDGKRHFRSMIRDARGPQEMFNYWRTASTELVALAPKAPFIGPTGFVPKGHEEKWATANTRSYAFLEYDGPQAPQRQPFAGIPAGALQEALSASDDIKATMGMYDAALGAQGNETSGRAILARQRESDTGSFHFIDNLSRAIRYAGRVLVEVIPAVYSQRQTVRILGEDMAEKVVNLTMSQMPGQPASRVDGDDRLYDISIGQYDVDVKVGPSYGTQREETREMLVEIMRAVPDAAPFLGDILMEHMDFQNSDKVAQRLKLLLPPQIQQAENDESNLPPEAMQAVAQANAKVQELEGALQQVQAEAQNGDREYKAKELALRGREVEGKLAIEVAKLNNERERSNNERSAQMGMEANGEPPEDRFQMLLEALASMGAGMQQTAQAVAASSAQTQQSIAASGAQTQQAIQSLARAMTAPRRIIRDENGRPSGVAIGA